MKGIKFLLAAALLVCFCSSAFGYTEKELNELTKSRVQQKVAQLNDNIAYMADKGKSVDTRNYYRGVALKLFLGKGEPYVEENGVRNPGVKMQTTSVYRKRPSEKLMKDYFTGLINLRYSKVDIESTKVHEIEVGDLRKVDDGVYVCDAYFEQVFTGWRDNRPVYSDRTRKKVKVYIYEDLTIDGAEYIIYLGDVTALETEKLPTR